MSFDIIAGPCSLDSLDTALKCADFLSSRGLSYMRASIYKMRTCPNSWRGLGIEGIGLLEKLNAEFPELKIVCEVRSTEDFEEVRDFVDVFQIGTRHAQNFHLIETIGEKLRGEQKILLKRGFGNTVNEFFDASRYVEEASRVWLCERGIRTFEKSTRNTLDISAVPVLKEKAPKARVFIDPSHSSGNRDWVPSLMAAAKAVGADGLLVEVHPDPTRSRTDARQTLDFETFEKTLQHLHHIPEFPHGQFM